MKSLPSNRKGVYKSSTATAARLHQVALPDPARERTPLRGAAPRAPIEARQGVAQWDVTAPVGGV